MNGVEVARKARNLQPSIKLLYTSGYTENSVIHRGIVDHGVTLLNKPYNADELLQKIQELLDG